MPILGAVYGPGCAIYSPPNPPGWRPEKVLLDHIVLIAGFGWRVTFQMAMAPNLTPGPPPLPAPGHRNWEVGIIQQRILREIDVEWVDSSGTVEVVPRIQDNERRPDVRRTDPGPWAPDPPGDGTPVFQNFVYDDHEMDFFPSMNDGPRDPWLYYRNGKLAGQRLQSLRQRQVFQPQLVTRERGVPGAEVFVLASLQPIDYTYRFAIIGGDIFTGGGHAEFTESPGVVYFNAASTNDPPNLVRPPVYAHDDPILVAAGLLLPPP